MSRVVTVGQGDALALHIVAGVGRPAAGAHTMLAIRIADLARAMGFRAVSLSSSKFRNSNARFIDCLDRLDRCWRIRVSNHHRPARSQLPHLDLISADGVAGLDEAREFLARVVAGEVAWFDGACTSQPVTQLARKRTNRCR